MDEKALYYATKYGDTVNMLSKANTEKAAMKEQIEELTKKYQAKHKKSVAMHDASDSMEMQRYYYNAGRIYKEFISDLTNLLKQKQ